jgi:hypothetical protein
MSEGSAAENQRERPEQPEQQDQAGAAGENAGIEGVLPVELIEQLGAWFRQTLVAGTELANLFRLELQLTLGDARRLVLVSLAIVPMVLLSWISLGVLASWLVYDYSGSVALGLGTFALLQLLVLGYLASQAMRFKRQLGFRRTKAHAKSIMQGVKGETPRTD